MIDHSACTHDRTSRDRAECRETRVALVDRLRLLGQSQRDLIEIVLDLAEVDTVRAPARDLLDLANARSGGGAGNDEVRRVAQPDSNATVGDLIEALGRLRRDLPVMLVTGDDTAWLRSIRATRSGIVELLAPGAE
jgi:hypothetical protein